MRIDKIVRVDDQNTLIDAMRSNLASIAMKIYLEERERNNNYALHVGQVYIKSEIASKVYECTLLNDQLKIELNQYSQTRRCISELLKWYKGLI